MSNEIKENHVCHRGGPYCPECEVERLTDEVERLQKEFRYLTEILSDGDWNEAIIMRVVYRALGGEE